MHPSYTLEQAKKTILKRTTVTDSEIVELADGLGRVPANTLYALQSQPGYDQSSYDGYVISGKLPQEREGCFEYQLAGEVAAGEIGEKRVNAGDTYRIMTGGVIPRGGWKVVPQEYCRVAGDVVRIAKSYVVSGATRIKRRGCELRPGSSVAPAGLLLSPGQLGALAEAGHQRITVHRQPRVSFFCTGSELVGDPDGLKKGLKVSSNRYMLNGLIQNFGGVAKDQGTVPDTVTKMCDHFRSIIDTSQCDIIISTGGMGPGKYDMLEEIFDRIGDEIIFTSLQLRPGKSTLFGILGGSLFFGLPGPPPAARALFYELVCPALIKAQGIKRQGQNRIRAYLEVDLTIKKRGTLKLQEAVFSLAKGICTVRPAGKREVSNCYMLCPGHRKNFKKGELVTVHSFQTPFSFPFQK